MKLNKLNRHISIMLIWLVMTLPFASAQATSPPTVTISNVQLNHGAQTVITWQTNVLANGYVEWGNTSALGTNTTTPQGTLHTATLNTVAGQTYYYRVVSCETTCASTQTDSFTAGPLFITTSIAPYVRTANIDIPGRTRAGARVDLYVNSVMVRSQNTSTEAFVFRGVQLQPVNNVTLRAFYNNEQAEKSFTLRVDSEPPRITVDMPRIATQPSVVARVTTTEPVNISVTTRRVDASPPGRPTALTLQGSTNNRVELAWTNASGATEYLVRRDGIIIGKTTSNTYADTTVGADRQYDYEILAVNAACMQSEPSATLAVTTPGGTNTQGPVVEVKASCERDAQSYLVTASADITVNLVEGENLVTFTATDAAGFESIIEETVIYDLAPPQFLEQNLDSLTPSYSPQVVVRGKLSEKGSVTVFVNDRAAATKATEDDGSFTIPVLLDRSVQVKTDVLAAGLDTGVGYSNKMQLEATDAVGQKTRTEQVDVVYAICGFGTDFDIKISNPVPDVLNPRLMHEGLQQLGISFSYEYKGGNNAVVAPGAVRVTPIQLAPAVAKEYDNSLVTISSQTQGKRGSQNAGEGYVQVTFTPITDPWTQFGEGKKPNNPTLYDIEDAIASHRMAYKDLKIKECKTPGVGCYRLFMKLEIPYQISTQSQQYLPEQPFAGQLQPENKVQQTCIDVEVAIDRRIDPAHLPQGFLKGMSETLGAIIEGVDTVLKPLRTIYQYLFYTCIAGWFISYVPTFLEQYNCKYSVIATAVSGEGKFDEGVAAINACKTEYQGQQESLDNCEACATWKKNKKWVADVYKQICDRVACPAAPSLQHYIKSRANQQLTAVNAPKATAQMTQYTAKTGGKLYQGSDCAAWMQERNKQITGQDAKKPPSLVFTTSEIEGIYNDWLKHRSDTRTADEQQGVVNCAAPHPATPECCGYEYMDQWGSACGIGGTLVGQGIDTFDEIQESTCLAMEKANKQQIGSGDTAVSCGGISNALAGFCTAEGGTPLDYIKVTTFSGSATENTGKLAELGIGKASDHYLYILLVPQTGAGATQDYSIKLGYIVEDIEFAQTEQSKTVSDESKYDVNKRMRAVELQGYDVQKYFSQDNIDKYYAGNLNTAVYTDLANTLCAAADKGGNCVNGKTMYDAVINKIGKPDQEYIIDPRKGIINAIRCICLPAVISYLQLWRNIMAAVKNCVDTIRFTGDGNPGVCQEMISKYACDLIYEALACFTEKFSVGGGRPGGRDLFGALTSAGTEMSNDIQGRYGGTTTYQAMFTQGQIVKSVCNFAFTGTWSLDFAAIADSSIDDFPIESQSFLYPCDRRFVSFNPLTSPPGMTTWIYHFGVFIAPGADIDIEFALKCSGGYKCSENDGFERGKCDCDTEKTLSIAPTDLPTRATKGEIVDSAVYYTVAGNPGGTIRYDKAVLTYKWKDSTGKDASKSLECRINQLGGAPNFCRFDMFSGAYRCQFGPEQGGIQLGAPEVSYSHNVSVTAGSPPLGVYALNENLNINVPIRQAYMGEVSETKFLQWEILGPGGAMVANNSASITKLDTNGDYMKNIGSSTFDPKVPLKKEWFGGATSAGGQTTTSTYWHTGLTTPTTGNWIANAQYLENGAAYQGNKQFVVEKEGTTYRVYNAGPQTGVNAQVGFTSKGTSACTPTVLPNTLDCTIAPGANEVNPPTRRLLVTLGQTFPAQPKIQAHINIGLITASGDFCTGDNRYKPVTFTVKIAAYDGNELGQITDMIAINPTTNEEARTTATFQAMCVDATDQKFKDMEKMVGTMCPVGYADGTTTGCFAQKPSDEWTPVQASCVTGICYQAKQQITVDNAPYVPNMRVELKPVNVVFKLPLLKETDSDKPTIVLSAGIMGINLDPQSDTFSNNMRTTTFNFDTSTLTAQTPLFLRYKLTNKEETYTPLNFTYAQTIDTAKTQLLNDLKADLLKQADQNIQTPTHGRYFKILAARNPASWSDNNKADVLNRVNGALVSYQAMKIKLDTAMNALTAQDRAYLQNAQTNIDSLVGKLNLAKLDLQRTTVPVEYLNWGEYLSETIADLSTTMDTVFVNYLSAYDQLAGGSFKVNGKTQPFVLQPKETLTVSQNSWDIYPQGAHYFTSEKHFSSSQALFPTYLTTYGAKEIRGTSLGPFSWTNPVIVTFELPALNTQINPVVQYAVQSGTQYNYANVPQISGIYQVPVNFAIFDARITVPGANFQAGGNICFQDNSQGNPPQNPSGLIKYCKSLTYSTQNNEFTSLDINPSIVTQNLGRNKQYVFFMTYESGGAQYKTNNFPIIFQ